jgi:hypothetical protein
MKLASSVKGMCSCLRTTAVPKSGMDATAPCRAGASNTGDTTCAAKRLHYIDAQSMRYLTISHENEQIAG